MFIMSLFCGFGRGTCWTNYSTLFRICHRSTSMCFFCNWIVGSQIGWHSVWLEIGQPAEPHNQRCVVNVKSLASRILEGMPWPWPWPWPWPRQTSPWPWPWQSTLHTTVNVFFAFDQVMDYFGLSQMIQIHFYVLLNSSAAMYTS